MAIFYDDDDRQMFLNLLSQQVSESFKVYCYCLMDNHFHLIVKSNKLSFIFIILLRSTQAGLITNMNGEAICFKTVSKVKLSRKKDIYYGVFVIFYIIR